MNAQSRVLAYLSTHPGSETTQISKALQIPSASVGTILWNLASAKKIRREPFYHGRHMRYRNYMAEGTTPPAEPSEPSPAPVPVPVLMPEFPVATPNTPLGSALAECVDKLASSIAAEVAIKLESLLAAHVAQLTKSIPAVVTEALIPAPIEETPEPEVVQAAVDAPPKKSVVICGLWDHLHRFVFQEFKDCFDITCFNPDEHPSRVSAKARVADYVIVLTSYVRHAFTESALAAGAKPINVTGSMSMLRKKLTELYVES